MQYVDFFGHKVSKLICRDNPFNGHSYITNYISGDEMVDYHTEEKIVEAMHKMEECGINTMLPLSDPYIIRILQHYRRNGGKMNFIFQLYGGMRGDESFGVNMRLMESVNPIGVYSNFDIHYENGDFAKRNFEAMFRIKEKVRANMGAKFGFATHHPDVIDISEKEGWDHDFYVACMYNFRRGRLGEKSGFITGKPKDGITIVESDREVMLSKLKNIKRPIIAFKLFGGGQLLVNKTEAERREQLKEIYNTVFTSLKPNDFAAIGIFQKYHDQITENVSTFNEWAETQK